MKHYPFPGAFLMVAFFATFLSPAQAGLIYKPDQTSDGLRYVIVSGEFDYEDDLDEFAVVVRSHNPVAVGFNSPGGNVAKAIELGRLIRSYGLHTVQAKGPDCASACALAFMGGVTRYAEPGAIGVHKSSFSGAMPVSSDQDRQPQHADREAGIRTRPLNELRSPPHAL